jgi:hypothetical protein
MDLQKALLNLHGREEFGAILEYLERERESCIGDFQDPQRLESPQALARLAGEIAAFDRVLRTFNDHGLPADGA